MTKKFKETFRSPLKETREAAEKTLEAIREVHSFDKGWLEHDAYIEPIDGKFRAVRVHEKIF